MVEPFGRATRPAYEPRIPPQMLDVTPSTLFPAVLAPVQTRLFADLYSQVVVAPEASVGIEPPAGRMALTAVRVSIDFRVISGELSRR